MNKYYFRFSAKSFPLTPPKYIILDNSKTIWEGYFLKVGLKSQERLTG